MRTPVSVAGTVAACRGAAETLIRGPTAVQCTVVAIVQRCRSLAGTRAGSDVNGTAVTTGQIIAVTQGRVHTTAGAFGTRGSALVGRRDTANDVASGAVVADIRILPVTVLHPTAHQRRSRPHHLCVVADGTESVAAGTVDKAADFVVPEIYRFCPVYGILGQVLPHGETTWDFSVNVPVVLKHTILGPLLCYHG